MYRKDPIPGIHKRRGSYLRYPRTLQEKRMSFYYNEEFVRSKRSNTYLVDAYDDLWRRNPKSWKHQSKKKKQYM